MDPVTVATQRLVETERAKGEVARQFGPGQAEEATSRVATRHMGDELSNGVGAREPVQIGCRLPLIAIKAQVSGKQRVDDYPDQVLLQKSAGGGIVGNGTVLEVIESLRPPVVPQ